MRRTNLYRYRGTGTAILSIEIYKNTPLHDNSLYIPNSVFVPFYTQLHDFIDFLAFFRQYHLLPGGLSD